MKKISLPIILVVFVVSCKSNNYLKYHRYINEAEYSLFHEDYQSASRLYSKGFGKVNIPFERDMFFYAASLWEVGEHTKSIALLDTLQGLKWSLPNSGYFQGMDSLTMVSIIQKNAERMKSIDARRENSRYLAIIDSLWAIDQMKRKAWADYQFNFPYDTVNQKRLWREVDVVDSMNILFFDSLVRAEGFIGGINMPEDPFTVGRFLIHHYDWVHQNKRFLLKAIKQGKLFPSAYAASYDKGLWLRGDTIYYGYFQKELGDATPEQVFKRCKKIGLSPYYLKTVRFAHKKGFQPIRHPYYEYYAERKKKFNCTKRFRL